jgi:hypothetical protein
MTLVLVLAGVALGAFLVDRLLLWMEGRGWIDYRRTYPGRMNPGQVGPAFLAIQGLLEPDKKHAAEEQTRLRTERDAAGDGDGSGGRALEERELR